MFPDVKGLAATIEANTEVQEVLVGLLKELSSHVAGLTLELKEHNLRLKAEHQRTRTNSTGPK